MKIPGYSAEASLRKTIGNYPNAALWLNRDTSAIVPQRIKLRDWSCDCDAATDICVCTSGGAMRVIHAVLGEI